MSGKCKTSRIYPENYDIPTLSLKNLHRKDPPLGLITTIRNDRASPSHRDSDLRIMSHRMELPGVRRKSDVKLQNGRAGGKVEKRCSR